VAVDMNAKVRSLGSARDPPEADALGRTQPKLAPRPPPFLRTRRSLGRWLSADRGRTGRDGAGAVRHRQKLDAVVLDGS
jgi:hypothetical protein